MYSPGIIHPLVFPHLSEATSVSTGAGGGKECLDWTGGVEHKKLTNLLVHLSRHAIEIDICKYLRSFLGCLFFNFSTLIADKSRHFFMVLALLFAPPFFFRPVFLCLPPRLSLVRTTMHRCSGLPSEAGYGDDSPRKV